MKTFDLLVAEDQKKKKDNYFGFEIGFEPCFMSAPLTFVMIILKKAQILFYQTQIIFLLFKVNFK